MRVLLIAEKLDKNDEKTSFFHGRIKDFAIECDELTVLVLEKNNYDLPSNVKVFSMGKEEKHNRLVYLYRFYKYIFKNLSHYDEVFVYRTPLYVVLGGPIWRVLRKGVTLWYSHTHNDWKLRVANILCNTIISPTVESYPINTNKLKILLDNDLQSYASYIKGSK